MKRFSRSMIGKTFTYLLCILSACVLAAGALSVFALFELDCYSKDEAMILEEQIQNRVTSEVNGYVWDSVCLHVEAPVSWQSDDLIFIITDESEEVIARSRQENTADKWEYTFHYAVFRNGSGEITDVYRTETDDHEADEYLTVLASVNRNSDNIYTFMENAIPTLYTARYSIYLFIAIAAVVWVLSLIVLLSAAGRSSEDEDLHPGLATKIPFDLLLLGTGALCVFIIFITGAFLESISHPLMATVILASVCFLLDLIILLRLCMVFAIRIKDGTLIKGSLTFLCIQLIISLVKYVFMAPLICSLASLMFMGEAPN